MVASKGTAAPLASVNFNVIKASTLVSVSAVSSSFRTGSSNVSVIICAIGTSIDPLTGSQVTTGAITSDVLKVAHCWIDSFPCSSSTGSTHM